MRRRAGRGHATREEGAFTLIEVLVVVAIFAIAMAQVLLSVSQSLRARADLEAIEERYHGVRLALGRLTREISMAYLSKNDVPGAIEPRTFFSAERHASGARLAFSYLGHQRLYRDADEADTAVVTYFVESDREDRSRRNLYRRETRRIGQPDPREKGAAYVACSDVQSFEVQTWDPQREEWQDEWDTTQLDGQPDRLPSKVRIRLVVKDERGRDLPLVTETRVFLMDPLYFTGS